MPVEPPSPEHEPPPQSRRLLWRSEGIEVIDFRCRAQVGCAGEEEPNATHSIVFVRRGVFGITDRGEIALADPTQLLFFNLGQPYRFAHPLPGGDECTILTLEPETAQAMAERLAPGRLERSETPFPVSHAVAPPEAARLHFELLHLLRSGASPPLATEDALAELVDTASACAFDTVRAARPAGVAARRRREIVEQARLILNERFESPPSLRELAAEVGCSPFHLSRVFRGHARLTLRDYLGRLRVRLAAGRLAEGAPDLTALALDLGFTDHSHFTNAFRRQMGVPPSRLRRRNR